MYSLSLHYKEKYEKLWEHDQLSWVAVVWIPTIGEDLKTDSFPVFESSRFIITER